jgi:capsular polysaccharide export protein
VPIVYGVKFWNRRTLGVILRMRFGGMPRFFDNFDVALEKAAEAQLPLICWASRTSPEQAAQAAERVPFYRVEDGFIRSVGLGAGLNAGLSFVLDQQGIYYDGREPSDLETLLQYSDFTDDMLERGKRLQHDLIQCCITKYNLPGSAEGLADATGRQAVLVVGQVADDASVRSSCSATINCAVSHNVNLDLLRDVRARFPDACIAYKPHPDVVSGLRAGHIPDQTVKQWADLHLKKTDIVTALDWCDHLETISSLAGFEALLRGKSVAVHGTPFYAGWGLTTDYSSFSRRCRKLRIEELVYGLLVGYGHYVHPYRRETCSVEELIAVLSTQKASRYVQWRASVLTFLSWLGSKMGL